MSQQLPPDFSPWEQNIPASLPQRKRAGVRMVILTLVLIVAVAVILHESVLQIRNVAVVGNREILWEDIVRLAGLEGKIGYFAVNEEKIRAGIDSHPYLKFERLEKEFPGTLTLYIKERMAWANVQVMGVMYLLDEEGYVLKRLGTGQLEDSLITVTGFQAKEVRVGNQIVPGTKKQLDVYVEVMTELALQNYADEVSELNLSDSDNLYLILADGYTVHLGNGEFLRAKIGTLRAVVAKLQEMGKYGGVIEASIPAEATYTPADL